MAGLPYQQRPRSALLAQILSQMQQQPHRISSYGQLAAELGAEYLNKKTYDKAMSQEQAAQQQRQEMLAKAMMEANQQAQGGPYQMKSTGGTLDTLPDPVGAKRTLGNSIVKGGGSMEDLALASQIFDLYNSQDKGEGYTLSPGQTRFQDGRPVASLPSAPEKPDWKIGQTRDFYDGKAKVTQEFAGYDDNGKPLWRELGRGEGTPVVSIDNSPKLPIGYEWVDPEDPSKGQQPVKGGPADRTTPDEAGKIASMRIARQDYEGLIPDLVKTVDGKKQIPDQILLQANVPRTAGYKAKTQLRRVIEAVLRARTGAAAPDTEVDNYVTFFFPSVLDNQAARMAKMNALDRFLWENEGNIMGTRTMGEYKPRFSVSVTDEADAIIGAD